MSDNINIFDNTAAAPATNPDLAIPHLYIPEPTKGVERRTTPWHRVVHTTNLIVNKELHAALAARPPMPPIGSFHLEGLAAKHAANTTLTWLLVKIDQLQPPTGRPPPNAVAMLLARTVARQIAIAQLDAKRVLASAEGGIAFYFTAGPIGPAGAPERYATLECLNESVIVALMGSHAPGVESEAWEVDLGAIGDTLDKFRLHLFQ